MTSLIEDNLFFLSTLIIINSIVFIYIDKISKILGIFDFPDNVRKYHSMPTPLIGGLIIFINFCLSALYIFFFETSLVYEYFNSLSNFYFFIFFSSIIFFIGIFDDKYEVPAIFKLFLVAIVVILTIYSNENFRIIDIRLSFFSNYLNLDQFALAFTLVCYLLFMNALNMFDGVNLQSGTYLLFLSIFLISFSIMTLFSLTLLISIIFFVILNFKGKIFMGDSGTLFISFIFSCFIISEYNYNNLINADRIFLLMAIPGFDLIRLFILRISNGQSPFSADRNHLHHYLSAYHTNITSIIVINSMVIVPYILSIYLNNNFIPIILSLILYILCIKKYSKKRNV